MERDPRPAALYIMPDDDDILILKDTNFLTIQQVFDNGVMVEMVLNANQQNYLAAEILRRQRAVVPADVESARWNAPANS